MDVFGGNEYDCTLEQVWRAEADNDDGLRFVDFDGTYRTETEVNHELGQEGLEVAVPQR